MYVVCRIGPVAGRTGQDNPNAHAEWDKHVLVVLNGQWYDPSYGIGPMDNLAAYESTAMKTGQAAAGGYVSWIMQMIAGQQRKLTFAKKDPANGQLKED